MGKIYARILFLHLLSLEMLRSSPRHSDERLNDLNRLIEEKDARIRLLQERIEQQDAIIKKLLKDMDTQTDESS